jgi:hypothetical protein
MAKMTLDEFVAALKGAYGASLKSVVLYGSAAGGEHHATKSDVNLLVVVDQMSLEAMRAASVSARRWADDGNPPPLIFTEQEWLTSADIFPMEYADILDRHRVLVGAPPFAGISVDRANLRLQLEHEAMGKLLRLRQAVLAAGGAPKRERALLEASLSTIMVLFRAVVRLDGQQPPTDNEALCRAVGTRCAFDAEPFARLVRSKRGGQGIIEPDVGIVLAGYMLGLEHVVAHLDRLPPVGATPASAT